MNINVRRNKMTEAKKIIGTVKSVSQKEKGWTINVNGIWYGYWKGKVPIPKKGDNVEFDFTTNDAGWNNIGEFKVTGSTGQVAKEAREDKALTMLVSYAKDLVIAKENLTMDSASEVIWASYDYFRNKLQGGQNVGKTNDNRPEENAENIPTGESTNQG